MYQQDADVADTNSSGCQDVVGTFYSQNLTIHQAALGRYHSDTDNRYIFRIPPPKIAAIARERSMGGTARKTLGDTTQRRVAVGIDPSRVALQMSLLSQDREKSRSKRVAMGPWCCQGS
jgi:hypothetical protein